MKIAIFGTGAMGSIYAGKLAAAGNEVWAIDCWEAHLDEIKKNCLVIEGPNGKQKICDINTSQNITSAGACDLYIIATKAMAVEDAAQAIIAVMEARSTVLTIQNGLGSGEILERYIEKKNILLGVADGFGASVRRPGYVHHNAMNLIRIGEIDGRITEKVNTIKNIWQSAGFNVKAFADINQLIWNLKLDNISPNKKHRDFFLKNTKIYKEFPPIFKKEFNRWGDLWDNKKYFTEKPILSDYYKDKYPTAYNEAKTYTWICYIKLK